MEGWKGLLGFSTFALLEHTGALRRSQWAPKARGWGGELDQGGVGASSVLIGY